MNRLRMFRRRRPPARRQAGLTLIELMVALVLGMLIAAAAVAALVVARQGFNSVDQNAQLRENARFAASLIQRVATEAGFENAADGDISAPSAKPAGLAGWDNALLDVDTLPAAQVHDSRDSDCTATDTSCANGSDIMVVRYKGASRPSGPGNPADGTMINCAGVAEPETGDRAFSIFHVVRGASGEPVLACTFRDLGLASWRTLPLVQGVEGFQVLYGVDTLNAVGVAGEDSVADLYLRAADVDALPVATPWSRVRSIRVGLVLRGPAGGAPDKAATAETIAVLGPGFSDAADTGSDLTVVADARMRHRLVFTVHLRNAQFAP